MRIRLLLGAVTAALALSLAAGSASANRSISVTPGGLITATSNGLTTFEELLDITTSVTLVGSLHRVIPKIIGWLAGLIRSCRAALGTSPQLPEFTFDVRCELTLEWHVRYNGFEGTLPNIAAIRLIFLNIGIRIRDLEPRVGLYNCLFPGNLPVTARGRAANEIEVFTIQPTVLTGAFPCEGRTMVPRGSYRLTAAQALRLV
jgi:hypothetical protein